MVITRTEKFVSIKAVTLLIEKKKKKTLNILK